MEDVELVIVVNPRMFPERLYQISNKFGWNFKQTPWTWESFKVIGLDFTYISRFQNIFNEFFGCSKKLVRREVKGLSELLLLCLQHFSDIHIFWKIFKVKRAQILTF